MKKKSSTLPDYQEALFTQQGGGSLESVASKCVRFTDGMYTHSLLMIHYKTLSNKMLPNFQISAISSDATIIFFLKYTVVLVFY